MYDGPLKVAGATGGSALLGSLGRLIEPLDYPRRALWNVPNKLAEGDWLGALPGLAGLAAGGLTAATGVGLPFAATVGSAVGGLGQALGQGYDEERFRAPTAEDVTGSDNPLLNFAVSAAGDPLSYAGGLGGARLGGRAAASAESSPLLRFLGDETGALGLPGSLPGQAEQAGQEAPAFYSRLQRALEEDPARNYKAQGLVQRLTGGKVGRQGNLSPEEIDYVGLPQLLAGKQAVSKEELLRHLQDNGLHLETTVLGRREGAAAPPKWEGYLGPRWEGAAPNVPDSYQETLLQLPNRTPLVNPLSEAEQADHALLAEKLRREGRLSDQEYARHGRYDYALEQAREDALAGAYNSPHFDLPNILAHLRTSERFLPSPGGAESLPPWAVFDSRTGAPIGRYESEAEAKAMAMRFPAGDYAHDPYEGGERVLHAEEIQSDWHQQGKKEGYRTPEAEARRAELERLVAEKHGQLAALLERPGRPDYREIDPARQEARVLQKELDALAPHLLTPDAPFKENWPDLALKKLLHDAAAGGFDRASWTAGDTIQGVVGGGLEGQRQFYDQLLPARANKLLKALGGGPVERLPVGPATPGMTADEALKAMLGHLDEQAAQGRLRAPGWHGDDAAWMEQLRGLAARQAEVGDMQGWASFGVDPNVMDEFMPHAATPEPFVHTVRMTPELRARILKGLPLLSAAGGGALLAALAANEGT